MVALPKEKHEDCALGFVSRCNSDLLIIVSGCSLTDKGAGFGNQSVDAQLIPPRLKEDTMDTIQAYQCDLCSKVYGLYSEAENCSCHEGTVTWGFCCSTCGTFYEDGDEAKECCVSEDSKKGH